MEDSTWKLTSQRLDDFRPRSISPSNNRHELIALKTIGSVPNMTCSTHSYNRQALPTFDSLTLPTFDSHIAVAKNQSPSEIYTVSNLKYLRTFRMIPMPPKCFNLKMEALWYSRKSVFANRHGVMFHKNRLFDKHHFVRNCTTRFTTVNSLQLFMFDFPCIITLLYIKNQRDATLAVLFISNCKITLHVSDAFCVHHQEY
jgi:hypothetical protein